LSDDFILAISHSGILSSVLDEEGIVGELRAEIINCFAENNPHDLAAICRSNSLSSELTTTLSGLVGIYGDPADALERIKSLCGGRANEAVDQLGELVALLVDSKYSSMFKIDTSLVSTSDYYGGFIFKGFLSGVCESVLTGGQYGKLLRRMGRRSDAIGFAIYLDRLELLEKNPTEYDVDFILLYSDDTDASAVARKAAELTALGKSVSAQKAIPSKLRAGAIIDLKGDSAK
jgi:ATP phosphoribosyltransferase regulatory subunit